MHSEGERDDDVRVVQEDADVLGRDRQPMSTDGNEDAAFEKPASASEQQDDAEEGDMKDD